ncbi:MAG: penicillin-binding protein [Bacteroidetes bacterium]|nr:penicillin-binding protein [Bacteroidota bacterium]
MKRFKEFMQPNRLGFHLALSIGITLALIIVALIFLNLYTRHGNEVEMPDFIGKDSKSLVTDSLSADFIVVVSESVFDKTSKPGTVLKQNPNPKEKVKRGRKVYVTVASDQPPVVKMPQLQDVSLRQAEIMLKAKGLILGSVIYKPSPYENAVLEQLYRGRPIASGKDINMGEIITLVVGKDIEGLPTDSTITEIVNP